ncbi:RluA family pseudouridine synthase [Desulfopila aestuarii]|uniref:Pseudouridine synthase n=1 Tax=Desulfopila aestuarii DSM 18488 TaxID=1121416 RepID=A0A1M7YCX0_9BACT|nr:RluA family pseudouridine synthase [Desulfopila aestuarii]SHO50490.1 ribosomal large subunit pseudouridine synthase D [Desulfopila aestuarii DSM 18488]
MEVTVSDEPLATEQNAEQVVIRIDATQAGVRLDHLLVQCIPDSSRSRIGASIRSGHILVDGEAKKAGYKLKNGELVSGSLIDTPPLEVSPEQLEFPILFEDPSLLVLSKPPGLVVHPGSGNHHGTLVNGLLHHCETIAEVGDAARPGIVHRLDKDTSGIMVVAKNDQVHRALVEAFKAREVEKEYIALVFGILDQPEGRIVAPIGRHQNNRQKMAVQETTGKYAVSNWRVLDEYENRFSKIRVKIETGRTHQIRVHMAHLGHPVAGDTIYGPNRDNKPFPRQMLHASRIAFNHPITGVNLHFRAPIWQDMQEILDQLATGEGL